MLLLIDNYDSFTYNLYQYLSELGAVVEVYRNDKITIDEIEKMRPEKIVISPGPGTPANAGISNDVISAFGARLPILGVCLGLQCIGQVYGGTVANAGEIRHGKTSLIYHDDRGVFSGVANPFEAVRYHSLAVKEEGFPQCLEISAHTENGIIMGLRHKEYPVEGVQFHPESIMTKAGKELLKNFLNVVATGLSDD
jgi:anthranilate synthase/aminodeoxychorismate synthase-like glutamine amidotransferase